MSKKDKKELIKSKRSYIDFLQMLAGGVGLRVQKHLFHKAGMPLSPKTYALLSLHSIGWRD